jgi:excisionase family DNA binding protein
MKDHKNLLNVREAAAELSISDKTLWSWVYARKIAITRVGRCVRIPASEVIRIVSEGTIPALEQHR